MNRKEISNLYRSAERLGIEFDDIMAFRRDSMTLNSWFEREGGGSNDYCSWCIERDPKTDIPYLCAYAHKAAAPMRIRIPDREKGARKRTEERCKRLNLHYYIQTHPAGWGLYLSREPLTEANYDNGVGVG